MQPPMTPQRVLVFMFLRRPRGKARRHRTIMEWHRSVLARESEAMDEAAEHAAEQGRRPE